MSRAQKMLAKWLPVSAGLLLPAFAGAQTITFTAPAALDPSAIATQSLTWSATHIATLIGVTLLISIIVAVIRKIKGAPKRI